MSRIPLQMIETAADDARAVIASRGAVINDELAAFKTADYSDAAALEVVLGVGLATILAPIALQSAQAPGS